MDEKPLKGLPALGREALLGGVKRRRESVLTGDVATAGAVRNIGMPAKYTFLHEAGPPRQLHNNQ